MNAIIPNQYAMPDVEGRFGPYGGRFVAETLMPLVLELNRAYEATKADPSFQAELDDFLTHYVGRPSPLYFAERLTAILRSPLGARGAVRIAGLSDWTRRNFGRWLFEDYPRALICTPRRWHRGMFTGPGAYRGVHAHSTD